MDKNTMCKRILDHILLNIHLVLPILIIFVKILALLNMNTVIFALFESGYHAKMKLAYVCFKQAERKRYPNFLSKDIIKIKFLGESLKTRTKTSIDIQ